MLWFILFGEYHRLYLQSETAATSERQTESTPTTSQRLCCLTFTPPSTGQWDPSQITEQKAKLWIPLLPDSVCHAVRPQGPHHAQSLKGGFVLPLLREFLLFWTLRLHKLLPAFGWTFNVSIQVSELVHGAQRLVVGGRKVIQETGKPTDIYCIFVLPLCDQWCALKVFDPYQNPQQKKEKLYKSYGGNETAMLIFSHTFINNIYSKGNAE